MIHNFIIIIGHFSNQKMELLKAKAAARFSQLRDFQTQCLKNSKYPECLAMAQANSFLTKDPDSEYYGQYIETVFLLSSKSPLYQRLKSSGFRVVSTDTLLRKFSSTSAVGNLKEAVRHLTKSSKNKEKTRRVSHALCFH